MREGKVGVVIVGADRVAANGDTAFITERGILTEI